MDQLARAIHYTAHDAGYTVEEIAERIGTPYRVLLNKVCPGSERNILSAREALAMIHMTRCPAIVHVFARAAGGKFVQESSEEAPTIMDATLGAVREHGDVGRAIHEAMADRRITDREAQDIYREVDEAIKALLGVRAAIEAEVSKRDQTVVGIGRGGDPA